MLQLLSKQRRLSQQWPTSLQSTSLPAAVAALLQLLDCWQTQLLAGLMAKKLCLLLSSAACLQRWLELLSLEVTQAQQVTIRPLHAGHACKLSAVMVLREPLATFLQRHPSATSAAAAELCQYQTCTPVLCLHFCKGLLGQSVSD